MTYADDFKDFCDAFKLFYKGMTGRELLDVDLPGIYFDACIRYTPDVVMEAIERAPKEYPQKLATYGQLATICGRVHAERSYGRRERETQETILDMARCQHPAGLLKVAAEPEVAGIYDGYLVCEACGFSKPVIKKLEAMRSEQAKRAAAMLQEAITAKPRPHYDRMGEALPDLWERRNALLFDMKRAAAEEIYSHEAEESYD